MKPSKTSSDTLPAAPQRFALYRRVSTEGQDDKDISLPAQRRQQLDYVQKEQGVVACEFEDGGISGRTTGREQFQAAVTAAKAREFDVLLIHKSDRVFRNRDDAYVYKALFRKYDVALASVTEPWVGGSLPGEKLMEGVMECINEFYSDNLSQEIKKGLREIAEGQGRQTGYAPYGYGYVNPDVQGSGWKVLDDEAAWVRWMYAEFGGGRTAPDLAKHLNALGIPTYMSRQRGRKLITKPAAPFWQTSVIRSILMNPVYLGRVQYNGEWFPGVHPALVEADVWERVQSLIVRRGKGRAEHSEDGLFVGGLLRCPHCGGNMLHMRSKSVGNTGELGGPTHRSRYRCCHGHRMNLFRAVGGTPTGCPGFEIAQIRLLRLLRETLEALQGGSPVSSLPTSPPRRPSAADRRDLETRRASILAEMSKLTRMRQGYLDLAASGDMRVEELRESLNTLQARQAVSEAALAGLDQAQDPPVAMTPAIAKLLLQVLDDPALTTRQKRDALRLNVDYFSAHADKSGVDIFLL